MSNPFTAIQRKVEGSFKHLGHDIEAGFKRTAHELEGDFKKVAASAEHDLKSLGTTVQRDINKLGTEIEHQLQNVVHEITGAVIRDAIHRMLTVLQSPYAPSNFEIEIGPLTLDFSDLGDRAGDIIETLKGYARHTPQTRQDIIKFVVALAPNNVTLAIGISLAFLFVESEDLSIAVRLSWAGDEITEDMLGRVLTILD